jgi:hypothetical protein
LLTDDQRRDVVKAPDEVSAMLRLKALGWGSKRIATEPGCARNTVRRWLAEGDWRACATASRSKRLDGLSDWIAERPVPPGVVFGLFSEPSALDRRGPRADPG